ncbi:MAG: cytochrome c [Fibrobacterota bacterium]
MKRILVPVVLISLVVAALYFFDDCGSKNKPSAPAPVAIPGSDSICYSRHVAPLLNARCAPCHVGQTTAGVRIDSYDLAIARIDRIIARTEAGTMPQGGPDLSSAQVDTLKAWRQNGEKQCTF